MAHRVCPWWLGDLLANPIRRLIQDPGKVSSPYVREGMTVLEPAGLKPGATTLGQAC